MLQISDALALYNIESTSGERNKRAQACENCINHAKERTDGFKKKRETKN